MYKVEKQFPDVSHAVSNDMLRPVMSYAVIQNWRIVATDSYILININLSVWLDDQEDINKLEGKILNVHLLKKLAKAWYQIIFKENEITFVDRYGFAETNYYSGRISESKDHKGGYMEKYDPLTGEYSEIGYYVNWAAIVPLTNKYKPKFDGAPDLQKAHLSVDKLNAAVKPFKSKMVQIIATSDNERKPYIVTPAKVSSYQYEEFDEFSIVMPILIM